MQSKAKVPIFGEKREEKKGVSAQIWVEQNPERERIPK